MTYLKLKVSRHLTPPYTNMPLRTQYICRSHFVISSISWKVHEKHWFWSHSDQSSLISLIIEFTNSIPLSLWRIFDAPNVRNIESKLDATSADRLLSSGQREIHFVVWIVWSWYIIHLYFLSGIDWKSTNSTWLLSLKSLVTIGLITNLRFALFLQWHAAHMKNMFQWLVSELNIYWPVPHAFSTLDHVQYVYMAIIQPFKQFFIYHYIIPTK